MLEDMKRARVQKVPQTRQDGFAKIEKHIERLQTKMGERFEFIEARIDQRFGSLAEQARNIDARLRTVEQEVTKTKNLALDIQDEVVSLNVAIENDAKRYFDHEQRITRLEKARA